MEILSILILFVVLWLAYKIGRVVLKLALALISILVGLAFLAWVLQVLVG